MKSLWTPSKGSQTLESLRGFALLRILPSVLPATPLQERREGFTDLSRMHGTESLPPRAISLHVTPQFPAAQTIRSPERSELRISLPKYFRLPDGFISIANRTISSKPSCSRCRSSRTNSQILSNLLKSACFDDNNGHALKGGSTFATKSLTFRTSNLRVLSDLSGRMNPHPHLSCIT
jgi:hypothetical protein